MAHARSLLPAPADRAQYEAIQPGFHTWHPAMLAICRRHALAANALVRLGEGTNIVFAARAQRQNTHDPPQDILADWYHDIVCLHSVYTTGVSLFCC